jgi:hypothetical protein
MFEHSSGGPSEKIGHRTGTDSGAEMGFQVSQRLHVSANGLLTS